MRDTAEDALFTEDAYERLLGLAAEKYQFCGFGEEPDRPLVIWRHDVDYSPHRALALARIETRRRLKCVYHLLVTSRYYNILEAEIVAIFRTIAELGHEIGLHFDMDSFGESGSLSSEQLDERIVFERGIVENLLGVELRSMSFHNYTINQDRIHERERICGMINAAAPAFRGFAYVSDSNGIWRYRKLEEALSGPAVPRLQVLTHPEWWTPEPLAPYARLRRSIDGRAAANLQLYLYQLERDGRLDSIDQRIGLTEADIGPILEKRGRRGDV
jgi:hypothetical protein